MDIVEKKLIGFNQLITRLADHYSHRVSLYGDIHGSAYYDKLDHMMSSSSSDQSTLYGTVALKGIN